MKYALKTLVQELFKLLNVKILWFHHNLKNVRPFCVILVATPQNTFDICLLGDLTPRLTIQHILQTIRILHAMTIMVSNLLIMGYISRTLRSDISGGSLAYTILASCVSSSLWIKIFPIRIDLQQSRSPCSMASPVQNKTRKNLMQHLLHYLYLLINKHISSFTVLEWLH